MDVTSIVGTIGATLTVTAFVPQVIKTIKTKDTKAISLPMYAMFTTGVFIWLMYGFLLKEAPIIIGNFITLVLALTVLIMKIRHG